MSLYDDKYLEIANNIINNGYYGENRTGMNTYKLPHQIMQFDLQKEFPVLTTKRVPFITCVKEMLWIYRDQSNDVEKLKEEKVNIWDEWMMEDGTIGTSYGYIVKKFNQIDSLINDIKTNPQSRRMLMSLWQNEYLETGSLYPCAFLTMWDISDDKLNLMLIQRSGDWGLGIPFNTTQYAVLQTMIAQITGYKPGLMTHVINNAHIYENHIEQIKTQISRKDEAYPAPKLWINSDIKDFYDFTYKDVKLIDYKHFDDLKMEVSV